MTGNKPHVDIKVWKYNFAEGENGKEEILCSKKENMQGQTKQEDKNKYYASSAMLSKFFPTNELSCIIPKEKKLQDDDFVKTTYLCVYFRTRKFNKNDQKNSFKSIVRIYRLFDNKRDKDKEDIEMRKQMTLKPP